MNKLKNYFFSVLTSAGVIVSSTAPGLALVRVSELGPLEIKFFAHQYERDTPTDRLARLEKLVFGNVQSGSLEERVAKLSRSIDEASNTQKSTSTRSAAAPSKSNPTMPFEQNAGGRETRRQSKTDIENSSAYPRVTELERSLLGKTFVSEPVRDRLSRLEMKAYGASSKVEDLAARMDKLATYASVYGMQPDDALLPSTNNLRGGTGLSTAPQTQFTGMLERVGALEARVIGHPTSNQALTVRIKNLENKVFGSHAASNNQDMTSRVERLWTAVNSTGTNSSAQLNASAPLIDQFSTNSQTSNRQAPLHNVASAPTLQPFSSGVRGFNNYGSSNYSTGGSYSNSPNNSSNYNPASSPFSGRSANQMNSPQYLGSSSTDPYQYQNFQNQFGSNRHFKSKHKNKGQHGSFLGKIGKVVVFAGSAAIGAGTLAAGAVGSMNTGYYGGGMGTGFGGYSPYSLGGFVPRYGTVSSIGATRGWSGSSYGLGSPFNSAYAGSFFAP